MPIPQNTDTLLFVKAFNVKEDGERSFPNLTHEASKHFMLSAQGALDHVLISLHNLNPKDMDPPYPIGQFEPYFKLEYKPKSG